MALLGARRAVRDLLRYSGAGDVQTLRAINRLVSEGLVEIIKPESDVEGARDEAWTAWTDLGDEPVGAGAAPPSPPGPPQRVIRLPDDEAPSPRARVAPFEIAIMGAASRLFNPLTEALLREGFGSMPVAISSYGIQELPVVPPAPEVIGIAAELGLEVSGHRTHRLAEGQLRGIDLVLGLDRFDLDNAITIGGAARERAFTLQEFGAWAERAQAPGNSELPVHARVLVARANRGRAETIEDRPDNEASSFFGHSEKSLATHIRTLCRVVVGLLRGGRRPEPPATPPPPPPGKGSYQIG